MFGNCESVPIRLSVNPSLKYSLLGSAVAFTNGRTAIELTLLPSDLPRTRYTPAAAIATTAAATPVIKYFRDAALGVTPVTAAVAADGRLADPLTTAGTLA